MGTLLLHTKRNMRKKKELCSVFFLRCIALQDPQVAKGEMSYMKKKFFYRGFNYFKITHFFQPRITTEAFIKKKEYLLFPGKMAINIAQNYNK